MTEFWVSKQRYWCKHCKCWLADNVSSRKIHENGIGHKIAVSEFLKGTFSKGREDRSAQRELQEELREIEQAALKSFETDLRKRGVHDYRYAAHKTAHQNPLSDRPVAATGRSRHVAGQGAAASSSGSQHEGPTQGEVPEWKQNALLAQHVLELTNTKFFYIDTAGQQQGPHTLGQMQSWYAAGYLPVGTMVAKDGGDEWLDVAQCAKISRPNATPKLESSNLESESAAAYADQGTRLEQRKRALGFGGVTADAPRRSAGSSRSDPTHKRQRGENSSGTNAVPLGDRNSFPIGVTAEGEAQRVAGEVAAFGLPTTTAPSAGDGVDIGDGTTSQEPGDGINSPTPALSGPAKPGRNQETGFGKWQTVGYTTAYTATADRQVVDHGYTKIAADPNEVPSDNEDAALQHRTVCLNTSGSTKFQKRKAKGKASRRKKGIS